LDRAALREQFLSNPQFRPKEQDLDTPYLDGFDGKLKLRGISGKEAIAIRQACTINGVLNDAMLTGKMMVKCLYLRAVDGKTGEPLSDGNTPLLEPTDNMEILEFDESIVNQLGMDVLNFVRMGPKGQEEAEKNLETAGNDNSTSPSPHDSDEQ
jgi:hypothetical protein